MGTGTETISCPGPPLGTRCYPIIGCSRVRIVSLGEEMSVVVTISASSNPWALSCTTLSGIDLEVEAQASDTLSCVRAQLQDQLQTNSVTLVQSDGTVIDEMRGYASSLET